MFQRDYTHTIEEIKHCSRWKPTKGEEQTTTERHTEDWRVMKRKKESATHFTHARTRMDGKQCGTDNTCTHDRYTACIQVSKESGEERRRERGTRMRTKHALTNASMVIKKKEHAYLTNYKHRGKEKKKRERERDRSAHSNKSEKQLHKEGL